MGNRLRGQLTWHEGSGHDVPGVGSRATEFGGQRAQDGLFYVFGETLTPLRLQLVLALPQLTPGTWGDGVGASGPGVGRTAEVEQTYGAKGTLTVSVSVLTSLLGFGAGSVLKNNTRDTYNYQLSTTTTEKIGRRGEPCVTIDVLTVRLPPPQTTKPSARTFGVLYYHERKLTLSTDPRPCPDSERPPGVRYSLREGYLPFPDGLRNHFSPPSRDSPTKGTLGGRRSYLLHPTLQVPLNGRRTLQRGERRPKTESGPSSTDRNSDTEEPRKTLNHKHPSAPFQVPSRTRVATTGGPTQDCLPFSPDRHGEGELRTGVDSKTFSSPGSLGRNGMEPHPSHFNPGPPSYSRTFSHDRSVGPGRPRRPRALAPSLTCPKRRVQGCSSTNWSSESREHILSLSVWVGYPDKTFNLL